MQKREGVKARLVNAALRAKTKLSHEGLRDWTSFLKYVRESPERQRINIAIALAYRVRQRRTHIDRVPRPILSGHIPFRPQERKLRHRRSIDLVADLLDCAADAVVHWDVFFCPKEIFHGVIPVSVG